MGVLLTRWIESGFVTQGVLADHAMVESQKLRIGGLGVGKAGKAASCAGTCLVVSSEIVCQNAVEKRIAKQIQRDGALL